MRFINTAPATCGTPWWHPVDLATYCTLPRLVPQYLAARLPDPFGIADDYFYLWVPCPSYDARRHQDDMVPPELPRNTAWRCAVFRKRITFLESNDERIEALEWQLVDESMGPYLVV